MKIVVLDGYVENPGDLSWEKLRQLGEVTVYDRTSMTDEKEIIRRIKDAELVYTNKTPITRTVIDACPSLRAISVLATGYNVVDYEYAARKGIPVMNVPAYGTASVAQFTIALLLEICHRPAHHSEAVHQGRWENNMDWCFWDYPLIELAGKTMGIIGFGRIGQAVGRIARALGMEVLAFSRSETASGREIARYVSLDELLLEADVISLHCPLFPETKEMINKDTISRMKDGVILLNSSRGGLIAEQDLADALNCGKIYAAGVDVVSSEPIRSDNPLLTAKNCIITPHIAWAPRESRQRIMDCSIRNAEAYQKGKPIHVVNGVQTTE
ncbi:MAG: D-2-hydroxyacid dehydrogenase [Clostridium sp.]|nr:D-2-hydroxyacid dehydrogenase [Clostridium sp.]